MLDNINPTLNFNSTSTSTTTTSNKLIQPNPTLSSSPFVSLSSSSKFNNSQNLNQQYQQEQEPSVIKFEHYYNNLDIFKDDDDDDDAKNKRNAIELIDSDEIFDLIRSITDPEHPLTLEDLSVVSSDQITVTYPTTTNHTKIHHNNSHDDQLNYPSGHKEKDQEAGKEDEDEDEDYPHVLVRFTPTIPHCSMATLIGLTIRVRLLRSLPDQFKVDIKIKEGTHQSENSVNKQLNDKERVAAALENSHLLNVVQQCLSTAHLRGRKE